MRTRLSALSLVVLAAPVGLTAQLDTIPSVTGSGQAEVMIVPDVATVSFDIAATGPTAEVTAARLDSATAAVLDALSTSLNADAVLVGFRAGPNPQAPRLYAEGSAVDTSVDRMAVAAYELVLSDVGALDRVHGLMTSAGVRQIISVTFSHSRQREIEHDLFVDATRAARSEAAAIARGLDMSIGAPIHLNGSPPYRQAVMPGYVGGALVPTIQDLRIRVQVSGRWRLVEPR